jgi:hypothetical protein
MYLLSLISDFPIVGASGSCFKNTDWNPICDQRKVIYILNISLVVEFQGWWDQKARFLPKNQHAQRKTFF